MGSSVIMAYEVHRSDMCSTWDHSGTSAIALVLEILRISCYVGQEKPRHLNCDGAGPTTASL